MSTANNATANDNILTTSLARQLAPGLLRNSIDERIVRIRPMSTPVDQISRCAGARATRSMVVEYYSVDTKATDARTTKAVVVQVPNTDDPVAITLHTDADKIFDVSETLILPGAFVVDGTERTPVQLYVTGKPTAAAGGGVECIVTNLPADRAGVAVTTIAKGSQVVRMGRAAAELDVQTAQFTACPRKDSNNCQIFKMQVEQSTMQRIIDKEAGWTFSDQEEAAIIDMRLGMEKNFLFGSRARIAEPEKQQEVFLTGGIWNQTAHTFTVPRGGVTHEVLVDLCRDAFTGNNGSRRKILIAGTGLVEQLSKLDYSKHVAAGETVVKWGIELKEIRSNFGSLYLLHSEIFDQCGHSLDGFVLDPDYITKYCHTPFSVEKLDLRTSGQRNTDAVVITEASCLVLRYPRTHMRVIGNAATGSSAGENL
ncbi:MAG: DUF5309 family protein [Muribaculaceae bacterium]|nr:DUF5309 family protein [Muribaculaceae bacterium]